MAPNSFWSTLRRSGEAVSTLGVSEYIRSLQGKFELLARRYNDILGLVKQKQTVVGRKLKSLVRAKKRAYKMLMRIEHLMGWASAGNRNTIGQTLRGLPVPSVPRPHQMSDMATLVVRIGRARTDTESALLLLAGATAGPAIKLTAWHLVSAFGTASTGTAMATLSGAASASAGTAWFGGGSLATGGAGMAGGAIVLTSMTVIPIAAVISIETISAIREASSLRKQFGELKESLEGLETYARYQYRFKVRTEFVHVRLGSAIRISRSQYWRTYFCMFPIPFISHIIRWVRSRKGRNVLTDSEMAQISKLKNVALGLLDAYELQILDDDGGVSRTKPRANL